MSYSHCSRDDQCENGGKCSTSGGWSQCICPSNYIGATCNWKIENLATEKKIIDIVMNFLNATVLIPASTSPNFKATDTNIVDQVANVLIGILKNPEPVEEKYLEPIIDLTWYITSVSKETGGIMEDYERKDVLTALDSVIKYTYYSLKEYVYHYYSLGEEKEIISVAQKAEYTEMRRKMVKLITKLRDGLYNFVDSYLALQYPGDTPYATEYETFEIFISSQTEKDLFNILKDRLGIQMTSATEYIRIPPDILKSLRRKVSYDEEFKFRIIKWKENPYVFSDFNTEVCGPVYNFAILDSNNEIIKTNFLEPVVIFLPISGFTKNLDTDEIRCKYYDEMHMAEATVMTREKVNVNQISITDEEKMKRYPEWKAEYFQTKNLIIEDIKYEVSKKVNKTYLQPNESRETKGGMIN